MTGTVYNRILVDDDGMVSYRYTKYGREHRRILFREAEDHTLWIKDPGTGKEVPIGKLVRAPGALIAILMPPYAS